MSWSYSGNPSDSDKDAVRFKIGDTDTNDQLLQDEEIEYTLSQNGDSVDKASVECCWAISRKFARLCDQELGPIKEKLSQKAERYAELAQQLENKSTSGTSTAILSSNVADAIFDKGMMDNEE